ncbi:hypothetical protein AB0M44_20565 [Streptosporangium subroseum]|uniref:hypothetical protein n=1 Tax=Streptosporangium subroseum TaxID=106412 RepID=UPI00342158E4
MLVESYDISSGGFVVGMEFPGILHAVIGSHGLTLPRQGAANPYRLMTETFFNACAGMRLKRHGDLPSMARKKIDKAKEAPCHLISTGAAGLLPWSWTAEMTDRRRDDRHSRGREHGHGEKQVGGGTGRIRCHVGRQGIRPFPPAIEGDQDNDRERRTVNIPERTPERPFRPPVGHLSKAA